MQLRSTATTNAKTARYLQWRVWLAWLIEPPRKWAADHGSIMAAAIAFYASFSLAPTLVIVIAVASFFFGADAVQGRLFDEIRGVVGNEAAVGLQAIVANAWHSDMATGTTLLSLVGVLVGASATFSSLNSALGLVWPVEASGARASIMSLVRVRLISFGLVIGVGFLVVILLILDAVVAVLGHWLWGEQNPSYMIASIAQHVTTLAVLVVAFSTLLKFMPDASVRWRDSAIGGFTAAVLFTGGKNVFSLYLAHAGTANTFGAAGSLAVVLMWLYYSAAVFLLGAEYAAFAGRRRQAWLEARSEAGTGTDARAEARIDARTDARIEARTEAQAEARMTGDTRAGSAPGTRDRA
jgi:membrane protein